MMKVLAMSVLLLSQAALRTEPPVVTALLGDWRGTGVVNGQPSTIAMTWDRAVGEAFVRLRFRNEMAAGGGRPAAVFEGHGYYHVARADGGPGTWFDSRGYMLPVRVTLDAQVFTSDWGGPTTEQGRTTYRLVEMDVLEVTDFVRVDDGSYREFGRSRLTRQTSGGRVPEDPPTGGV